MRRLAAVLMAGLLLLSGCVEIEIPDTSRQPGTGRSTEDRGDGQGEQEGYRFATTLDNGDPVRWSSCEPIPYVVRPRNEPDGARRLLRDSAERISRASGLELSFRGETDEGPDDERSLYQPDRYGDRWAPVLVTWATPDEYPRLEGQAVGYGGAAYVRQGGSEPRYVTGMVVLDAERLQRMSADAVRGVMLHELAHVVGLGHVDDRGQLMNPVQYGRAVTTLQDGDLAGLKELGAGPCLDPVEPRRLRP